MYIVGYLSHRAKSVKLSLVGSCLLYTALLKTKAKCTAVKAEAERIYAIKGDDAMDWIRSR